MLNSHTASVPVCPVRHLAGHCWCHGEDYPARDGVKVRARIQRRVIYIAKRCAPSNNVQPNPEIIYHLRS